MRLTRFLWRVRWQLNVERTSLTHHAAHPDAPAVCFDDELAECESQAGAAHAWNVTSLDPSKFLKDQIVEFFRNAWTVVLHSKEHSIVLAACGDLQLDRTTRMSQCVLKDVGEHTLQKRLVSVECGRIFGDRRDDRRAFLREAHAPLVQNLRDECARRDFLTVEHDSRFLDLRDLQQVTDKSQQLFRFGLGVARCVTLLERHRAEVAVSDHFQRREHRREWSLEIVDDHLHQVVAYLFELAQFAVALLERVGSSLELEQAAYTGAEHETIVRLGQKVVAASFDTFHAVGGVVQRRHEDDWNARSPWVALDTATHFESRGSVIDAQLPGGHRDVENTQVGVMLDARSDRRRPIDGRDRAEAQSLQLVEQKLHVRRHIVGDQNERWLLLYIHR